MANKQLGLHSAVIDDTSQAIELDDKNIKAYLLAGQTMAILARMRSDLPLMRQSISKLTKGQSKQQYEKQLILYIYRAKKLLWFMQHQQDIIDKTHVLTTLKDTLHKDTQLNDQEKQNLLAETRLAIGDPDESPCFDIPEHLLDPLTHQIMLHPVTTPYGTTYEKDSLMQYLSTHDNMDPISHKQVMPSQIYNNLNLKSQSEDFLLKQPWAFEYSSHQHHNDIPF